MTDRNLVNSYATEDGTIIGSGDVHVSWHPEWPRMQLDGYFTAGELRQLAAWIEAHRMEPAPVPPRPRPLHTETPFTGGGDLYQPHWDPSKRGNV
jgi:hypothetical protein